MRALLDADGEHHVNEGAVRNGRATFAEFCGHIGVSYRERLEDTLVLASPEGSGVTTHHDPAGGVRQAEATAEQMLLRMYKI